MSADELAFWATAGDIEVFSDEVKLEVCMKIFFNFIQFL